MEKTPEQMIHAAIIENQIFPPERNPFDVKNNHYDLRIEHKPWEKGDDVRGIHTVPDLIKALRSDEKNIAIEAKVFGISDGQAKLFRMGRRGFVETVEKNRRRTFRESVDSFALDVDTGAQGGIVGHDYVPLLGGPFTKQLYYIDYLKMHNACFYAYHHDPIARRTVNMLKHFTLGRGFRVDVDGNGDDAEKALALWEAFAQVNDFYRKFGPLAIENSTYGEIMLHWLPNNATKFTWKIPDGEIPKGIIPRIRLTDPSTIWEIITYPEDISRVLAYQQIFPTQYQTYTAGGQPGTKFIYQQIPAQDMMHFKMNCMDNEKRGRSDLFPILSYLKRLRDGIDYELVASQKNAAWAIDTIVDGSKDDVNTYVRSQRALGTIPQAGSEFVHSKKIERKYLANSGGSSSKASSIFDWSMNMIAMGAGIPVSYYGGHQASGGATRAGAVVGTEPATKMFEDRQNDYDYILQTVSRRLFDTFGLKRAKLRVTFPEIITQDAAQKLQNLALAQSQGWVNKKIAAELAAKEIGIDDYDFKRDSGPSEGEAPADPEQDGPLTSNGGLSGEERNAVKRNNR